MTRGNKKKRLIEKLIDAARVEGWLAGPGSDQYQRKRMLECTKVGERILNLTDEERELLKTLTVEDFEHRLDEAALILVPKGSTGERRGRLGKHLEQQRLEHERKQQEVEDKKRLK